MLIPCTTSIRTLTDQARISFSQPELMGTKLSIKCVQYIGGYYTGQRLEQRTIIKGSARTIRKYASPAKRPSFDKSSVPGTQGRIEQKPLQLIEDPRTRGMKIKIRLHWNQKRKRSIAWPDPWYGCPCRRSDLRFAKQTVVQPNIQALWSLADRYHAR